MNDETSEYMPGPPMLARQQGQMDDDTSEYMPGPPMLVRQPRRMAIDVDEAIKKDDIIKMIPTTKNILVNYNSWKTVYGGNPAEDEKFIEKLPEYRNLLAKLYILKSEKTHVGYAMKYTAREQAEIDNLLTYLSMLDDDIKKYEQELSQSTQINRDIHGGYKEMVRKSKNFKRYIMISER